MLYVEIRKNLEVRRGKFFISLPSAKKTLGKLACLPSAKKTLGKLACLPSAKKNTRQISSLPSAYFLSSVYFLTLGK